MAQDIQAIKETLYDTEAFDIEGVRSKQLCAVTDSSGNIIGTGIPQQNKSNFTVTADGEKYVFDNHGNPVSANAVSQNLTLKMATSNLPKIEKGTVGATKNAYVRSVDADTGRVEYNPDPTLDASYEITIEGLNARDQFALQALHGMFRVMEDPSAVSKNEITHYCEAAYLWASYMMVESSKARAVIEDADISDNTKTETVGYLESNTEKLLNNIVAAIERNDIKEVVNGSEIYSDRIAIPKLMDFLNAYVKDGNSTVGLKDVITAINSLKAAVEAQTQAITAQTTALNSQKTSLDNIETAISNLQLSPVINNNITIPENNGGE